MTRNLMNLTVRPITAEDRSAWERLWQAYLVFYKSSLEATQTDRTWQRLNEVRFNLHGLLAVDGDEVVGMTHYLFHPSSWTDLPYCYLQDLYVDEHRRGQGIARALIDAVVQAASAYPAQRVYWLTQEDNSRARLLYDKIASATGFVQYRIAPL